MGGSRIYTGYIYLRNCHYIHVRVSWDGRYSSGRYVLIRLKVVCQPVKIIYCITDYKLDLVVHAGVCGYRFDELMFCLGRAISARQFLGAKPLTPFHRRWAERNHWDHYTDSEPVRWLPNSLVPTAISWQVHTSQFYAFVWCSRESNPGLLHPERMLQLLATGAVPQCLSEH